MTHGAVWMAQKAQEGVPHAPTSGTGAELVKQRMLLDSGSSALSPSALSTGLAAIPGNLYPQHLKQVKSGMGSVGRGGQELRHRFYYTKRKQSSSPSPPQSASVGAWEQGSRVRMVCGRGDSSHSQEAVPRVGGKRGTLRRQALKDKYRN